MICLDPIPIKNPNWSGAGYYDKYINVPCGKCLSCRINRQNDWTKRCMDEASLYKSNSLLTLTYNDDKIPKKDGIAVLNHNHWCNFIHDFRRRIKRKVPFFMCGEYGPLNNRPHYHALLFGISGNVHTLAMVQKYWLHGFARLQSILSNNGVAGYVAKHQLKADLHSHPVPPYQRMSVRPSLGLRWIEKNKYQICMPSRKGMYLKYGKKKIDGYQLPVTTWTKYLQPTNARLIN